MHLTPVQPPRDWRRQFLSRRAVALSLVVALHVLLMLLVLRPLAAPPMAPPPGAIAVELLPERQTRAKAAKPRSTETPRPRPATAPRENIVAPPPVEPDIWSQVIPLTREEFAAADIAKSTPRPAPHSDSETGSATAAADDLGPAEQLGGAPAGEQLYNAEWYREPTHAELAYYLPAGMPRGGWGMIACQTVEGYRVDDCRAVAQFPPGSGLAHAVLQAAWQFRVRPPRIGGRTLVGAWVRIRIDYSEARAR